MTTKKARSAGLLVYRGPVEDVEVLLVHPGGPYWAKRDEGAWSIPKGECVDEEAPLATARREFFEETGSRAPDGRALLLGEVVQAGGKRVTAFAVRGEFDPAGLSGNTFEIEWPPRSGRIRSFPEVDRAAWFALGEGRRKLLPAQAPFLDRLNETLRRGEPPRS